LEDRALVIQAALLIDKPHKFLGLSTRAWINVLQKGVYRKTFLSYGICVRSFLGGGLFP
jgi:hypothetical protein